MKQEPKVERRRTQCGKCLLVAVRDVAPTIASGTFFGRCDRCDRPTMQRGMPGPLTEEELGRAPLVPPTLDEILGPGERFLIGVGSSTREISRAEALAALERGDDEPAVIRRLDGEEVG